MKAKITCPECGYEQICPCEVCKPKSSNIKPWIWINNELIKCSNCEFTAHVDQWERWSIDKYQRIKDQNERMREWFKKKTGLLKTNSLHSHIKVIDRIIKKFEELCEELKLCIRCGSDKELIALDNKDKGKYICRFCTKEIMESE